jgi:diguanylate cyclase (GGDEF)-like protein
MVFDEEAGYETYLANLKRGTGSFVSAFTLDGRSYTQCCEAISKMDGWYLMVRLLDDDLGRSEAEFRQRLISYSGIMICITVLFMTGLLIRIVKQKKNFEALSVTDTMTGLLNKKTFEAQTRGYISSQNSPGVLIFVDVDDFKHYNDSYGHQNGDLVLKKIASELLQEFGSRSLIGRYGGDEFILFLKNTADREYIKESIERVRLGIEKIPLEGFQDVHVTFSAGAALFPSDADSYESLCKAADEALYEVKKDGKGKFYFCSGYSWV